MKIALFCSSRNVVPPMRTGGTGQPIFYLAKGLADRGHEVYVFAARGAKIPGCKIVEIAPFQTCVEQKFLNIQERIASFFDLNALSDFFRKDAEAFDIIQFNSYVFYEILPFAKFTKKPIVVRINYPHELVYPYIKKYLKNFENVYYLPISEFIKSSMPSLDYLDPIYPSLDFKDFKFSKKKGDYLLFIGRICRNKGAHIAVQAAKKAKQKLLIAGRIDQELGEEYFEKEIKPFLNSDIKFLGEVNFAEKIKLYQGALATLFPIQWNEPFGNVQIESMACGTPVITFKKGANREAVADKKSGYIVNDLEGMIAAIENIRNIDRRQTREWAEENFSNDVVLDKYEEMYNQLIKNE